MGFFLSPVVKGGDAGFISYAFAMFRPMSLNVIITLRRGTRLSLLTFKQKIAVLIDYHHIDGGTVVRSDRSTFDV